MGKMKKLKIKTKKGMRPAQRDSKMSNGRLSGVLCWPHGQNRPAQRDSGMSKLVFILNKINFQKILLNSVDRIKKNKYVSYH
jgi:hypothetical protein